MLTLALVNLDLHVLHLSAIPTSLLATIKQWMDYRGQHTKYRLNNNYINNKI